MTNISCLYVRRMRVIMEVYTKNDNQMEENEENKAHTGRPSQPSSSPWSDSQLSTPMVGKIRDATCNIERR